MSFFIEILLIYALIVLGMMIFQRKLIYYPVKEPAQLDGWESHDVNEIKFRTNDGLELVSWYKEPTDETKPVIFFAHGNAGHLPYVVPKLLPYFDVGYGVFILSYRGYSGNPGKPKEQGLYADARAGLDHLASLGVQRHRIVLYGESLGAAIATQMAYEAAAKQQPYNSLVLEAPFSSLGDAGADVYPFLPVRYVSWDKYKTKAKIAHIDIPLLIIHGEKDEVIKVHHGRDLLETAKQPKQGIFVKEAGHNNLYSFGVYEQVIDFIDAQTSQPGK